MRWWLVKYKTKPGAMYNVAVMGATVEEALYTLESFRKVAPNAFEGVEAIAFTTAEAAVEMPEPELAEKKSVTAAIAAKLRGKEENEGEEKGEVSL